MICVVALVVIFPMGEPVSTGTGFGVGVLEVPLAHKSFRAFR